MDFVKMLKEFDCSCGKRHSCAIRHIHIGKGALQKLPETVEGYSHILLVADPNTYAVCGEAVQELLGEKRYETLILKRDGVLIPNEQAIAEVEEKLTDATDLIVGVGSGVIQDLCKFLNISISPSQPKKNFTPSSFGSGFTSLMWSKSCGIYQFQAPSTALSQ